MSETERGMHEDVARPKPGPKAIVVFSDGTGNSAGKLFRTNVWRLYQTLETDEAKAVASGGLRQIARYDDGVGTSSFRPLALLGGAVGWGMKRNVIDLYSFICRNYQAGDRIYAFGFSRGAFTIRVLVSLIDRKGLLLGCTEKQLTYAARDAYRSFRQHCFTQSGALVRWLRAARDRVIGTWRRVWKQEDFKTFAKDVDAIEFVGVWDTVAAYGMPIAELTRGIDKWVWPLSLPDHKLPDRVRKACHALALDDERDTFHPLLWDETKEEDGGTRLEQVWFAGMHSDVGGGYPDDGLAHVPLRWMLEKAEHAGLRFKEFGRDEIERHPDPLAPMHDSRRGLAAYYRYQPRRIGSKIEPPDRTTLIMQNPDLKGHGLLCSVKVHESVFRRIRSGTDLYAPVVLPAEYEVVGDDGAPAPGGEARDAAGQRLEAEEATVWNDVWRRRVNYYLTVAASLFLALMPWLTETSDATVCQGPQCLVVPVISGLGAFLPGFAQTWITTYEQHPLLFLAGLAALAGLLLRGGGLQRDAHEAMRALWAGSLGIAGRRAPTRSKLRIWFDRPISWLRRRPHYQRGLQTLKWKLAPNVVGIVTILLILSIPLIATQRARLVMAERSNELCAPAWAGGPKQAAPEDGRFATNLPCWHAGRVNAGETYDLNLVLNEQWQDGDHDVRLDRPEELVDLPWYVRFFGPPVRRYLSHAWHQPLAKIVPNSGEGAPHVSALPLKCSGHDPTTCSTEFVAARSGDLYLFVNDAAVTPWGLTRYFYRNNKGEAMVSVNPITRPTYSRSADM